MARSENVTRALVTQIMNLLMLAPEIQEEILFLVRVEKGRPELILRDLQAVAIGTCWKRQSAVWSAIR